MHLLGQTHVGPVALWVCENLRNAIYANIVLACFNMLPILPLDGGRVLTGLLPGPAGLAIRRAPSAMAC